MRTLVMGDIHGAYEAMLQCLERAKFDYENDLLIQLGDVTDGHSHVHECVEELLKIRNLIALKGNHDDWFNEFILTDFHPYFWNHGGRGTLISYLEHTGKKGKYFATRSGFKTSLESKDIPQTHKDFFKNQRLYYIDEQQRCFVHAGFKRNLSFYIQRKEDYYWNRTLWQEAYTHALQNDSMSDFIIETKFTEIYIGHTPTTKLNTDQPLRALNILNIDTGAGHNGRLTIMDATTKVFWQSDSING